MGSTELLLFLVLTAGLLGGGLVGYGGYELSRGDWWSDDELHSCVVAAAVSTSVCETTCPDDGPDLTCYGDTWKYILTPLDGNCTGRNVTWADVNCDVDGPRYAVNSSRDCWVTDTCGNADLRSPADHHKLGLVLVVLGGILVGPVVLGCLAFVGMLVLDKAGCCKRRGEYYRV